MTQTKNLAIPSFPTSTNLFTTGSTISSTDISTDFDTNPSFLESYPDVRSELIREFFTPLYSIASPLYENVDMSHISKIQILRAYSISEIQEHLQRLPINNTSSISYTFILYFGLRCYSLTPSNSSISCVRYQHIALPAGIPYAQTQILNLAFFPRSLRTRFHSDFRIIVEYLFALQSQKFAEIRFHRQPIQHLHAVLQLLQSISNELRFHSLFPILLHSKGGITMCDIMNYAEKQGLHRGLALGFEQGRYRELYRLVQKGLLTLEEAASEHKMSPEELIYKLKNLEII